MLKPHKFLRESFPGTGSLARRVLVLLTGVALAFAATASGQNTLDWDDPANFWDFVGESASPEVESISHLYSGVDGTPVDITVTISADDGVDMTSEGDPDRDSLSDWLNEDDKHAGIFDLFTNNGAPGNTFNMGMNEGDRDDVVITEFTFSQNVKEVAFTLYDVDKTNWNGALGFEESNRGSGWIDAVTVTGYSGATPVMPVFQNIRNATASAPANPYDAEPDNTAYVGTVGNTVFGRWEVSEKSNDFTDTPENDGWATDGIYGGDVGNVSVYFPSAVDRVELRHDNVWSVVGNEDRDLPDEYWGGHSMEFGISALSFVPPQPCTIGFTDNTGTDVPGYQEGADIYVTLDDADLDTDPATKQTVVVTVQNLDNGDAEIITLTETGNSTGIFRNAVGLPTSTDPVSLGDGTIQLSAGDTLSVSNTDPEFGPCTDTVTVLLKPIFTKAVDVSTAMPNDTVTYTFEPRYPGNELLTDVTLTDVVPPVTTFDAVGQGGSYDAGWREVSWTLGSNQAGTIGTFSQQREVYAFRGDGQKTFWEYDIAGDSFTPLADAPENVKEGGALTTDGTDLYAFRGDDTGEFWKYTVATNTWSTLATVPIAVNKGGALAYDGTYIYALRGDNSTEFWRYDIALNTWSAMASTPAAVLGGGALVFDGTYIYAFRGDNETDFWRYDIGGNTWSAMAAVPLEVDNGGALAFDGTYIYGLRGKNKPEFYRYDIGLNTWSALASAPGNINLGGALTYEVGGDKLYAFRGNGSPFYEYDIGTDTWSTLTSPPNNVKWGGALVTAGNSYNTGTNPVAGPSLVVDDGVTPDTITVSVTLSSSVALTGVTPPALTVTGTGGASATYVSGPVPASDNISAGGSATFTYTYTAVAGATPGDVKFTVPAFTSAGADFATADTNSVLVTPVLSYSVTVDDPPGGIPPGLEIVKNTAFLSDTSGVIPSTPSNEVETTITNGVDQPAIISSQVWLDEDGDGVQDAGESGIANVTVLLLDETGTIIDTAVTDINGDYVFPDVLSEILAGVYTVTVDATTLPSGLAENPTYDEDGTATPHTIESISLDPGEEYTTADFGYNWTSTTDTDSPAAGATGAIGDTVWLDADGDGVQDPGEAGMGGVTVNLFRDSDGDGDYDTPAGTAVTGPDGSYIFDGLAPDSYVVVVDETTLPAGYVQTGDPDGTLDGATSSPVALGPGDVWVNGDFGYQPGAGGSDIGDTIYLDTDGDGTFDAGEPGIEGVTVSLLDVNGDVIATTMTDANGNYLFPDLPAGTYSVKVTDTRNVLSTLVGQMENSGDPDGGNDHVAQVIVDGIADDLGQDFGYTPMDHDPGDGFIGDTIFFDYNGNGTPDPGEGIEGVVVSADDGSTTVYTVTDENGNYYFGDLDAAATYTVAVVTETLPSGLTNTVDPDDPSPGNSISTVDLSADLDGIDLDQDFGYRDLTFPNTIGGTIWEDTDADGTLDETGAGLEGVTVVLLDANGYIVSTTTTDGNGDYSFSGLPDGTYTVDVTDDDNVLAGTWHSEGPTPGADGNSQVEPYTVTVSAGATDTTGDFGYYEVPGAVGDYVWEDLSGDGLQDGPEPGIGGVLVTLTITYPTGDVVTLQTLTDGTGAYSFDNLLLDEDYDGAGGSEPTFVVTATTPDRMLVTLTNVGADDTIDSDDPVGGETAEPTQGTTDATNDFGYVDAPPLAVIGNRVWLDEDGDGVQDAGEDGIGGVIVELYDAAGIVLLATTTTDADGGYVFRDVEAGTYTVKVDTTTLATGLGNQTGDPDASFDDEHAVTVLVGEEYLAADFGYNWVPATDTTSPASGATGAIGDLLWNDADGDGEQDPGEAGIPGVTVNLYNDPDGDGVYDNLVTTTSTDATGHYIFDGIAPDAYVVEVDAATLPAGYTQTGDPDGTLDNMSEPTPIGPGDVVVVADFGYQPAAGSDIGDTIYFDTDADSTQDAGEPGIAGVTVTLLDVADNPIATTTTDENGNYLFPSLPSGSYTVVITDTESVLNDLVNTEDSDLNGDRESSVTVNGIADNLNQDFGFTPEDHETGDGIIGDTIFHDRDGSGSPDAGEGLEGVTVELWDATGTVLLATTTTDENGNYYFGNLNATTTYTVKVNTASLPAGMTNTVDPDVVTANESVVDLNAVGGIAMDQDFGYMATTATPNTVGGTIWEDTNADGTLDESGTGVQGVTVVLRDTNGDIVGTTTTDGNGDYSFGDLPDGTYTVEVTDEANVVGGMWHSTGPTPGADNNSQSDPYTVAVAGGATDGTGDFGYYSEPGSVGDFVWFDIDGDGIQDGGEPGLAGVEVTLTITYPNGDVVTLTDITDASGNYDFGELLLDENYDGVGLGEPTYVVTVAAPPGGTASPSNVGGDDTIDSDDGVTGETAEVVQGGTDATNDFGFVGPKLAKSYAAWTAFYGLTGPDSAPSANPDGDIHANLEEYAIWMDPESGVESGKGFCVAESLTVPGQMDAFFTRAAGLTDVTYTLEGIADLASTPGGWADTGIVPTIVDNGDGSETVTYEDLESVPALAGGTGFVRLKIDLASPAATDYTEVYGWEETTAQVGCETISAPFLQKPTFSGTVDSMTGSNLEVAGSAGSGDVKAAMDAGKTYYVEVVSGADEGHRFAVDYVASDADTIAIDTGSAENTVAPVPDLSGQTVILRAFWTIGELYPIGDYDATNDPDTADRVIVKDRGTAGLWKVYYALDDGVNPVIWNEQGTPVADEGDTIVGACAGAFVHRRGSTGPVSRVGMVRANDYRCPLLEGYNLVAGGWAMDQSPADRAMTVADGIFAGGLDPSLVDQVHFWFGDATAGAENYDGFWLVDDGGSLQRWADMSDVTVASQDAVKLFESNRSALYNVTGDRLNWVMPLPWTP